MQTSQHQSLSNQNGIGNGSCHVTEASPLLIATTSTPQVANNKDEDGEQIDTTSDGRSSVQQTILNQMKTCLGTGVLALPQAAREGGLLLHVFGLFAIALWNTYSSTRLVDCQRLLEVLKKQRLYTDRMPVSSHDIPDRKPEDAPPKGTTTLGSIAWYALGPFGLHCLDTMIAILLLGVLVAYNDAILTFLQSTPFSSGSTVIDALAIAALITPLSLVPDMSYLAKTSATGLSVLGGALLVIAMYGISSDSGTAPVDEHGPAALSFAAVLPWLPRNGLVGASHWFGCSVFGFGIVPLTFNYQESMAEPERYGRSTLWAMMGCALLYNIVALSLLFLYPDVQSDILSELPTHGLLPIITRLAMVVVTMTTVPLIIVPCGELLEGKLLKLVLPTVDWCTLSREAVAKRKRQTSQLRLLLRVLICLSTVVVAIAIPEFVSVVTFVGCLLVGFISFCAPPALHLLLLVKISRAASSQSNEAQESRKRGRMIFVDLSMLFCGCNATAISTIYVFQKLITHSTSP